MVVSSSNYRKQSVLHIWNTAGVGSIIAKYQNRLFGWKTWVVTRKKFDPFGVTNYGDAWECRASIFYVKVFLKALKYRIIHVHASDKIARALKTILPWKKVILHYHGSDIRGKWEERRKYWERVDALIVSTEDLLEGAPEKAVYVPNPVDMDLFYPRGVSEKGTAFHISYDADELAIEFANEHNLSLTIQDRKKNPTKYNKFAEALSKYEYYIDVKVNNVGRIGNSMSKTGLESLACGIKVIRWDGEIIEGLPEEHGPENVVISLNKILRDLMA